MIRTLIAAAAAALAITGFAMAQDKPTDPQIAHIAYYAGEIDIAAARQHVIVWKNDDIFRNSATARDKSFDVDPPAKTTVRMDVTTPGTFDFFCKFHRA